MDKTSNRDELYQRVFGELEDVDRGHRDRVYLLVDWHVVRKTPLNGPEIDTLRVAVEKVGLLSSQTVRLVYEQVAKNHKVPKGKRDVETCFFADSMPTAGIRTDFLKTLKEEIQKKRPLEYGEDAQPLVQFLRSSASVP